MCGILGMCETHEPSLATARGRVDVALDALRSRGPDARGSWTEDEVLLGHTRLSIIDLSPSGAQPMVSPSGRSVVVFNGEIYNHHALRRELEQHGFTFRSRSDTEVILVGYEHWGASVVERLDGMFAFALWDREERRLLLARDRTGKKPLFYEETATGLRWASRVTALEALGTSVGFDVTALPFLLLGGYVPSPRTLYSGVRELEPGTWMIYTPGGASEHETYWQPSFGARPFAGSYEDARKQVRALVVAAVERRLEADVPLGAFLSGGVDSTIIVGTMSRLLGRKVRTFSIGFEGDARFDETSFARQAADAFDTEHTEFRVDPSAFDLVEKLVEHHDGPFGDSSAIPTSIVSMLAREHVTVALTGDGGDELFCGYERFLAAEASELLPSVVRQGLAAASSLVPRASGERSLTAKARRFLEAAALPLPRRLARWTALFFDLRTILRREVAEELGGAVDEPLEWHASLLARTEGRATLARVLEHNFRSYLPYDLLRKADRSSMLHSLELRSPFLDTALIDFVSQLPAGYLRRGRVTKRVLKDAFDDLLPRDIVTRRKMGFGVPLGTWFRGPLRDYMNDLLESGARIDAYLDRSAVHALLDEHAKGMADHGHKLWLLLTLEVWLRRRARSEPSRTL